VNRKEEYLLVWLALRSLQRKVEGAPIEWDLNEVARGGLQDRNHVVMGLLAHGCVRAVEPFTELVNETKFVLTDRGAREAALLVGGVMLRLDTLERQQKGEAT